MNLTPEFWVAVAAVVAVISVGGAMILHIIKYAYQQGQTDQRLKEVESKLLIATGLGTVVSALTATVESLVGAVNRLDRTTERLEDRSHPRAPEMRGV